VASECEESELAVKEKRQNEANLLVVLVIGWLQFTVNQGEVWQAKRTQFGGRQRVVVASGERTVASG